MTTYGLTGGIGSGKSTAANAFADLGIPIVNADQVARDVVAPSSSALAAITRRFGDQILQADGGLDRAKLRRIIFSRADDKQWLEDLLHPLIRQAITEQLAAPHRAPYRLLESPLLLETDQRHLVRAVILVDVRRDTQLQRAMRRDNSDRAQIEAIIDSQMPRAEKLAKADYVLDNEGSPLQLVDQVRILHTQLCN